MFIRGTQFWKRQILYVIEHIEIAMVQHSYFNFSVIAILICGNIDDWYAINMTLTVYIDSKGGKDQVDVPTNMCGFISRLNDALFKPKLHVQCMKPMEGRYVYIEAWGVPNRWSRLFSAVLCEVMVYE